MKVPINSVLVWNSMWYFVWIECMLPQTMETLGFKTKVLPRTRTSHFVNETDVCNANRWITVNTTTNLII